MTSERFSEASAFFYGFEASVVEVVLHEPGGSAAVPEALVHDLWEAQRFDRSALCTTAGAPVVVLDPGTHNTDRGPDFTGARLRIDGIDWRGDVEIHVTSGAWLEHGHHRDARYNSVVLHVTLQTDLWTGRLARADGTVLPEVALAPRLEAPLRALVYAFHTREADVLPCAAGWPSVPADLRERWIRRMAEERLQDKQQRLARRYQEAPDLERLLYERLFAGLGYSKNAEPMLELTRRIPLSTARGVREDLDLEALFLGTAGLLPSPSELLESDRATADYVMALRDRFARLQHELAPTPMERSAWRFFRLRPANFPPLRIAQGCALLREGGLLRRDPLGRILTALRSDTPRAALQALLRAAPLPFWRHHTRLTRTSRTRSRGLGAARADALLVNAVVPVVLLYAEGAEDAGLERRAWDLLHELPAAADEITRRFAALGQSSRSAFTAQGLHQLYRTRCSEARCLSCAVGKYLLERQAPEEDGAT